MGRRRPRARAHTAAALVLAALVACSSGGGGAPRAEEGKRAPTFSAPRLVGSGNVRLVEFRGKPVLLNFFASWCTPCRQELPLLQKVHDSGDAVVIGVLFRDSAGDARRFLRELGVTIPTVDDDGSIADAYRVGLKPGLPLTWAITPDGIVATRHIGELRAKDIPELIARASS